MSDRKPSGKWYAFYTRVHGEKLAEQSIREIGYRTFIPFERRMIRGPNRKPRVYETPLFPRYGFVSFDVASPGWGAIKDCRGVVDLLKWNGTPGEVPDSVVHGLHLAERVGAFDKTKPPEVGMEVLITHGPFADFVGKVKKARARDRVEVLLSLFGSNRTVSIAVDNLKEV